MTLILALGNRDYFVQLSDRRLSSGVQTAKEDSGKVGTLVCDDARLVFGFAGLATVGIPSTHTGLAPAGTFSTQQWLVEALGKCGAPDFAAEGIVTRLCDKLTTEFATNPLLRRSPRTHTRLTVMLSGFIYRADPPRLVEAYLTNFQHFRGVAAGSDDTEAWDHFELSMFLDPRPADDEATTIQRIGAWPALTEQDIVPLQSMLKRRLPARAVVGKALEIFGAAADRRAAAGTVGRRISAVVLPADPHQSVEARYYSDVNSSVVYYPDHVTVQRAGGTFVLFEPQSEQPGTPGRPGVAVVPRSPRNAPCPCGSGTKYKRCHGRGW